MINSPRGILDEALRSRAAYAEAYEAAKRDLAEAIKQQQKLEKKKLFLRKTLQDLAVLCEVEGEKVKPSPEAANLLGRSSLADEVRTVLLAGYPNHMSPRDVKGELEKLGHDLSSYRNPQSAIQMVLKRMVKARDASEMGGQEGGIWEGMMVYRACPSHTAGESATNPRGEADQRKSAPRKGR